MNYFTAIYDVSVPCDYRCVYCRNDWTTEESQTHAMPEQVKGNIEAFKKNGFRRVVFTGGEFFIIPYWKDILSWTKSAGLDAWIITNGYGIEDSDIAYLSDHVSRINVSFHAPDKKRYNQIMRPPSKSAFDKVVSNMKLIGNNRIELGIFYSPIKANYNLLYDTVKILTDQNVKITDVNVNRIIQTQSTEQFFNKEQPLNRYEHTELVRQVIKINRELKVHAFLEAYPFCFIDQINQDEIDVQDISQPCFVGRKAIAFNTDGTMKLCPATHFSISDPIQELNELSDNDKIKMFQSMHWRNKQCKSCDYWEQCLGGCHATIGDLYNNDPLIIDDEIELRNGIDPEFFDLFVKLYKPFLNASFKKAIIQYTIYSKKRYNYPIGLIAVNHTKANADFLEIALIPEVKGSYYAFLTLQSLIKKNPIDKIGWTVHKANLPSIKLLKKLNGGFYKKTTDNIKRIEAEGFFRPNRTVSKVMRESLDSLMDDSKLKYEEWLQIYDSRTEERRALNQYLNRISNENH